MTTSEDIDTGTADRLAEITAEQDVLRGRLEAMEARRDNVSGEVYERVRSDYERRLADLDEAARPLREEARRQHLGLSARIEAVERQRREIELEREESDLRHALGEVSDEEHEPSVADCDERIAATDAELEAFGALEERFVEAFGSRAALEAQSLGDTSAAAEEADGDKAEGEDGDLPTSTVAVVPDSGEAVVSAKAPTEDSPQEEVAAETDDESPGSDGEPEPVASEEEGRDEEPGPVVGPPSGEAEQPAQAAWRDESTRIYETPTEEMPPPPPLGPDHEVSATIVVQAPVVDVGALDASDDEGSTAATRIIAKPRLVLLSDEGQPKEFILGIVPTTIGRSPDNDIQLIQEAISRRHAEVGPSIDGYLVRDLGSENGILINGEQVDERVLNHGDIVQIGSKKLLFKEG